MNETDLGKLKGVFGVSAAFLQRAAVVSFLSFVFFLLMMFGFYWRQNIGYFLLATAFLIVNILTLIGWLAIRGKTVRIYENGFRFKKFSARWRDIRVIRHSVVSQIGGSERHSAEVELHSGQRFELPHSIEGIERIVRIIEKEKDNAEAG